MLFLVRFSCLLLCYLTVSGDDDGWPFPRLFTVNVALLCAFLFAAEWGLCDWLKKFLQPDINFLHSLFFSQPHLTAHMQEDSVGTVGATDVFGFSRSQAKWKQFLQILLIFFFKMLLILAGSNQRKNAEETWFICKLSARIWELGLIWAGTDWIVLPKRANWVSTIWGAPLAPYSHGYRPCPPSCHHSRETGKLKMTSGIALKMARIKMIRFRVPFAFWCIMSQWNTQSSLTSHNDHCEKFILENIISFRLQSLPIN